MLRIVRAAVCSSFTGVATAVAKAVCVTPGLPAAAWEGFHSISQHPPAQESGEHVPRVLVTGACGQIGQSLVPFLRSRLGVSNVVATDIKATREMLLSGPFHYLDVASSKEELARLVVQSGATHIVHLASLLSAVGERNPQRALQVNMLSIQNILQLAVEHNMSVFSPSSIAVYGPTTPRLSTPDSTIMQPKTMYGITKVHQELLGQYYADRFGVDYRSLRFPGIISSKAQPGGGTTDYAVDIFHAALRQGHYQCFLSPTAALPMLYMPDALRGIWELMLAPRGALTQTTYNVTAMSFTPEQLALAIRRHIPDFQVSYQPDFRDSIAKSWPESIDDSSARKDWGWQPKYLLEDMTQDMLLELGGSKLMPEPSFVAAA